MATRKARSVARDLRVWEVLNFIYTLPQSIYLFFPFFVSWHNQDNLMVQAALDLCGKHHLMFETNIMNECFKAKRPKLP